MSDVIELRGLRLRAIVGVLAHEREYEQPLVLDLDLERSFDEAARRDDVAATTNYAAVLELVERVVAEGRFALLETLARRVAHAVLESDDGIVTVSVRVHKVRPPVVQDLASAGVSCTVSRSP